MNPGAPARSQKDSPKAVPRDITTASADFSISERIIMKRSIISILVAGLCAGTATAVLAANADVKTNPKPAETSQSRAADQNNHESMHEKGAANFKRADKDHDGTLDRKEAKCEWPRLNMPGWKG